VKRLPRIRTLPQAIHLPRHPLSDQLRKLLKAIVAVHLPPNLKPLTVIMSREVPGAVFDAYTGHGPYSIYLNPNGNHPELSLLHEIAHYLEWQAIPKSGHGPRNFQDDPLFWDWLDAAFVSQNVLRLKDLRDEQAEETSVHSTINYLLSPEELWARSYSQYITHKTQAPILSQQIAAENKAVTGTIIYAPYWQRNDFFALETALDTLFERLGWLK